MSKFYAVFRFNDLHLPLAAKGWQQAAREARSMNTPSAITGQAGVSRTERGVLERVGVLVHEEDEYYAATHEILGPCVTCGRMILDGCCDPDCGADHAGPGGWTTSENGEQVWCSVECRDRRDKIAEEVEQ